MTRVALTDRGLVGKVCLTRCRQAGGRLAILAMTAAGGRSEAQNIIESGDTYPPADLVDICPLPTKQ